MRKSILALSLMLCFSILPMALFSSCDKDTNSYLDVLVLDEATKKPVSKVKIEVKQNGGVLHASGVTKKDGIFSTHFNVPAILIVTADLTTADYGHRRNETRVRLIEGETVTSTIILPTQVSYQ